MKDLIDTKTLLTMVLAFTIGAVVTSLVKQNFGDKLGLDSFEEVD